LLITSIPENKISLDTKLGKILKVYTKNTEIENIIVGQTSTKKKSKPNERKLLEKSA